MTARRRARFCRRSWTGVTTRPFEADGRGNHRQGLLPQVHPCRKPAAWAGIGGGSIWRVTEIPGLGQQEAEDEAKFFRDSGQTVEIASDGTGKSS